MAGQALREEHVGICGRSRRRGQGRLEGVVQIVDIESLTLRWDSEIKYDLGSAREICESAEVPLNVLRRIFVHFLRQHSCDTESQTLSFELWSRTCGMKTNHQGRVLQSDLPRWKYNLQPKDLHVDVALVWCILASACQTHPLQA